MLVSLHQLRAHGCRCARQSQTKQQPQLQTRYRIIIQWYSSATLQPKPLDNQYSSTRDRELGEYVDSQYKSQNLVPDWIKVSSLFGLRERECLKVYELWLYTKGATKKAPAPPSPLPSPSSSPPIPPLMHAWLKEEVYRLSEACKTEEEVSDWKKVAGFVGNNRTARQCRSKWKRMWLSGDPRVKGKRAKKTGTKGSAGHSEKGDEKSGDLEGVETHATNSSEKKPAVSKKAAATNSNEKKLAVLVNANASVTDSSAIQPTSAPKQIQIDPETEKALAAAALARQRKLKRLYPKIKPLLTQILSWRIEDNADDYPPGFPRNELRKVQDTYKDAEEYAQVFELLRMLECWGQFQNAMTVTTGTEVAKASVQGVMRHSAVRSIIVMVDTAEAQVFQENDIVVGSQAPGQGAIIRGSTQARAGVEEMQRNSGMSYFHRISGRSTFLGLVKSIVPGTRVTRMVVSAQLDKPGDAQAMDTSVVLGTEWELCKLLNIAPLQREYAALQSLKYLEDSIVKDILQPRAIPPPQVLSDKEIAQVMRAHELNRPQAEAVATAMKREDGFTLIHGPPGTGKTKTIVGLVGALLSKPETEKDQTKRKRLLICAPSNAAVDVIVERLAQDGVRDSNGNAFYPRVVRVGQISESSTSVVRNSALDTRVDTLLGNPSVAGSDPDEVESGEDAGEQEQEEGGEWDLGGKGEQLSGGASGRLRDRMRRRVLWDADVVCATLSTSGGRDLLKAGRSLTFETVIIDEAAQSNELTCLIPLKYGCKRCIMVGDPYQLPPTIFSHVATAHLYKQSMFLRLQKNAPEEVARMLSIQYRMHPEISTLPSRLFYEAQLMDGPQLAAKRVAPWHRSLEKYAPYAFFDIASGKEKKGAAYSVYNMAEVTAAIQLVHNLITDHPDIAWGQRIGIITPYRRQLHKLVDEFVRHFGPSVREAIEFNTVDGFQGKEKDVVIFSCVRAGTNNIGFLADRHRMNVGLTRARRSLFVLGNAKQLVSSPLWEILIDDAQRRGVLNRCALPLFGWKPQPMGRMPAPLQRHDGDTSGGGASEFELEEIDANSQQLLNNSSESVVEAGSTPPSAMSQPRD